MLLVKESDASAERKPQQIAYVGMSRRHFEQCKSESQDYAEFAHRMIRHA